VFYLTIQPTEAMLTITCVAKNRGAINNMGKILLNCIKDMRKRGYEFQILLCKMWINLKIKTNLDINIIFIYGV